MFFVDQLEQFGDKLAIVTETGLTVSYKDLADQVDRFANKLGQKKRLLIVETANELEPLVAYLGALRARHPVILLQSGATLSDDRILKTFAPYGVFRKTGQQQWSLERNEDHEDLPLDESLSILLSTSGTTGSTKLVRLSVTNIEQNTQSIVSYLGLNAEQTVITTLPFHYSFGMSIINTHLAAGGKIVLTDQSISRPEFWSLFRKSKVTCLYGVPFTFDLLERTGFREHTYPDLQFLSQAGGRLPLKQAQQYSQWADKHGKRMFVMYGQTEGSPRISYIPPEHLEENCDCIGIPIPGGHLELIDQSGNLVTGSEKQGELIYRGPNVMMGYALKKDDLIKGQGENVLRTGDIACRNENGMYRILGRKSRFIKIFSLRISLDEVEVYLAEQGFSVVTTGVDDLLVVATTQPAMRTPILQILMARYKLTANVIQILELDEYPLLASGKIDSLTIRNLATQETSSIKDYDNLLLAYSDVLSIDDIRATDSFLSLGGDSLLFVTLSMVIEQYLEYLPDNWEALSIAELEKLSPSEEEAVSNNPSTKRAWLTLALIASLFVSGEVFLQTRSYLKTGRSALALLVGQSTIIYNEKIGTKTYRPNLTIMNRQTAEIVTNSSGLRSPEIASERMPGEIRIAVVGASTVAGAYAKSNKTTFPSLLEARLRSARGSSSLINVINGGVPGNTLEQSHKLTNGVLFGMNPSMIIVYSGFNDITSLCNADSEQERLSYKLGYPKLPDWLLSTTLIRKNTTALRIQKTAKTGSFDLSSLDELEYRLRVEGIVQDIVAQGITPVLMTVARSYINVDASPKQRKKLAETALYHYPCLDLAGIIEVGKIYNSQIRKVAKDHNLLLVDLENKMPGGREYFMDASHFTLKGSKLIAETLANALSTELLVD